MLSVITPVYNSGNNLNQSIDSILAQTYGDFELVLVDDGSTDGSSRVCDQYAEADSRIKVIHQSNSGQAAARNRALDICKGDYIAFVDSDDYIHPEMFEVMIKALEKENADVAVCGYVSGEDKSYSWKPFEGSFSVSGGRDFLIDSMIGKTGKSWLLWDKIFKKSCFDNIRLPEGRIFEDNATVYRIIYGCERVVSCDCVFYYYFTNADSTVNKKFTLKRLDYLTVLEEMIAFFEKNNETDLLNWAKKSYLYSLAEFYNLVKENCSDKSTEHKLKSKLKTLYRQEREKYPIDMKTYPLVIQVLHPYRARMYWLTGAVKSKFKRM